MFHDFGALGYGEQRMKGTLGCTWAEFRTFWKEGGRKAYQEGFARSSFEIERSMLSAARKGDLAALDFMEKRAAKIS